MTLPITLFHKSCFVSHVKNLMLEIAHHITNCVSYLFVNHSSHIFKFTNQIYMTLLFQELKSRLTSRITSQPTGCDVIRDF